MMVHPAEQVFMFSNRMTAVIYTTATLVLAGVLYVLTHNVSAPLLVLLGYMLSVMDTSIGMGYGTVGTPILLIIGIASKIAVPAILLSQFAAAALGSITHRKLGNADVIDMKHNDGKVAAVMVSMGLVGAIIGVALGVSLPKVYVNSYIGLLVLLMGIILLVKPRFSFSWRTLFPISVISGFNKAISGGGYGPVSTSGLLISGKPIKNSVGITVFSVAVINLFAFALYLSSSSITSPVLVLSIVVGAILGSQVGPRITHKMVLRRDTRIMGVLVLALGALTLITTFVKF